MGTLVVGKCHQVCLWLHRAVSEKTVCLQDAEETENWLNNEMLFQGNIEYL